MGWMGCLDGSTLRLGVFTGWITQRYIVKTFSYNGRE